MKKIDICFCFLFAGIFGLVATPAYSEPPGVGNIAVNLMEPVTIISDFLASGALITGITCLFAALVRYMQHRVNPLAHPISTVVFLFIAGVILVLLPLAYRLTESGIPFTLIGGY